MQKIVSQVRPGQIVPIQKNKIFQKFLFYGKKYKRFWGISVWVSFCIRAVHLSLLDIIIYIVTAIPMFYTSVMKPYINSVTLHNKKSRNRKENTLCTVGMELEYQSPAKYLKIRSRHSQVFYRITALKKSKRLKENTSVTLLVLIQ